MFGASVLAAKAFLGGISPRVWKILAIIAAILLCLWFLYRAVDSYGDRREADGVAKEKAAWLEADRKLQEKVTRARGQADASAAHREAKHTAEVAVEREKINEAIADGRSPFDVLFGG